MGDNREAIVHAAQSRAAAAAASGLNASLRASMPALHREQAFRSSAPVARSVAFPGRFQVRAGELVERNGTKYRQLNGVASVTEEPYEMYDFFGPYNEIMDENAFDATLKREPDVAFLLNHRGLTMARTVARPGADPTLLLSVGDEGLLSEAYVNPNRGDVRDMLLAIEDGVVTEMSFAFMIVRGIWSPDYTEFRIKEVDLDRGDVSAVNFGANPYTSIEARVQEIVRDFRNLPHYVRTYAAFPELAELESRVEPALERILETDEALLLEPIQQRADAEPPPPAADAGEKRKEMAEVSGGSVALARAKLAFLFPED